MLVKIKITQSSKVGWMCINTLQDYSFATSKKKSLDGWIGAKIWLLSLTALIAPGAE